MKLPPEEIIAQYVPMRIKHNGNIYAEKMKILFILPQGRGIANA